MNLVTGLFSGFFNGINSFMGYFGYSLSHPFIFTFRIACLYLACMNMVAFFLRYLNFAYWRLFENFKYLVMFVALVAHLFNTLGDLGSGIVLNVISIVCATIVCLYIVDFSWVVGQKYVENKTKLNHSVLEILLLTPFVLIGIIWYFLLRDFDVNYTFYIYLCVIMVLMLFKKNGSIITSALIICFTMIQKYIQIAGYTNLGIGLQIMLLYVALDREGKEAGIQSNKSEYPPKTYFFFACLEMYIYFLLDPGSILFHSYILGLVYVVTLFV